MNSTTYTASVYRQRFNRSLVGRMLRLTELKLPLDHTDDALRDAIVERLGIETKALTRYTVFRRAVDARKRGSIALTYTIDAEVSDEARILKKYNKNNRL